MKLHILKIKPMYFYDVTHGIKTFELRKDDRDYECNDLIHFVDEYNEEFTAHTNEVYRIKYVLRNTPQYRLQDGYCILTIEKLKGVSDE